jgi:hypothetical protein
MVAIKSDRDANRTVDAVMVMPVAIKLKSSRAFMGRFPYFHLPHWKVTMSSAMLTYRKSVCDQLFEPARREVGQASNGRRNATASQDIRSVRQRQVELSRNPQCRLKFVVGPNAAVISSFRIRSALPQSADVSGAR